MRKVIKGGDVNFSSYPDTFSSSEGELPGVGCAGTKNNALAAAGEFSQNGGYYSFGQPIGSPIRASGTGMVQVNDHPTVVRPMNVFSKRFSGLAGGKQIGCKKGGKKHRKSTNRRKASKHRSTRKHLSTRKHRSTRKHLGRSTSKRSSTSKHRSTSKRSSTNKHRSLRIKRGGDGPQPYGNTPMSFGQTFNKTLTASTSALATPTPLTAVSNCPYN